MKNRGKRTARTATTATICLAALVATGCAAVPARHAEPRVAPLPEPHRSRAAAVEPPPSAAEILSLTPEMISYLDTYIDHRRYGRRQLNSLSRLLLHPGLLGIEYDARRTATAAETFRKRSANCMSLSVLFIAMARELGMEARFQQVELVPQWDMDGDVLYAARHVNVYGRLRGYGTYVMDFYPYPDKPRGRSRILTDEQAIGQFYNNLGAGRLADGDYAGAWVYFRAAIRAAPGWSDTWSNLGLVYQRVGDNRSAEAMLRHAIALDPDNASAINNLAVHLHRQGRHAEAQEWLAEIQQVRERNPYYYYALAQREEAGGNYRRALSHIQHALDMKRDESLFRRKAAELARLIDGDGDPEVYRATGAERAVSTEREPAFF